MARAILLSLILAASLVGAQEAVDTCVECHADQEDELLAPVHAAVQDVHSRQGLSCADCHGGDPAADDPDLSMDWDNGFLGAPAKEDIPGFCGRCHSDAAYIRDHNPALRVDQETLYRTSFHGQRLVEGDQKVATCTDCHQSHGILPASDPRSPVYPTNVPATCGACHADADYMAGYGIPTDQLATYGRSVHGRPLLEGHDISAPACNDCHGNHGAMPPGVKSLANVCGQCHPVNSELVNASPHRPAFEHLGIAACKTCHSHHEIRPPTDDMVGTVPPAICVQCHSPEMRTLTVSAGAGTVSEEGLARGWEGAARMRAGLDTLRHVWTVADSVVRRAERAGMSVEGALYDLHEAQARLTRARSVLHAFDPDRLVETTQEGLALSAKAEAAGYLALDDWDFRRQGLVASLIVIGIVAVALYAKIRTLDPVEPDE